MTTFVKLQGVKRTVKGKVFKWYKGSRGTAPVLIKLGTRQT
jgi:hypothetical protein